jgi:hypothetical protein
MMGILHLESAARGTSATLIMAWQHATTSAAAR